MWINGLALKLQLYHHVQVLIVESHSFTLSPPKGFKGIFQIGYSLAWLWFSQVSLLLAFG